MEDQRLFVAAADTFVEASAAHQVGNKFGDLALLHIPGLIQSLSKGWACA